MSERYGREKLEVVSEGVLEEYSVPDEPPVSYVSMRKTIDYDYKTRADIDKRFLHSLSDLGDLKVLVVGAGTLGNDYARDLAYAGFKHLTIVDMDTYEFYNLPRSTMIRNEDVGEKKALALARRVAEAAPFDIEVTGIDADISRLGAGFIEGFDLVLSPVDSWSIRAYVSRMARVLDIPHITSGTAVLGYGENAMMATTITVEPKGCAACYECLVKGSLRDQQSKLSCLSIKPETQAQVLAFSAVSAGLSVQSAIALMTGKFKTGAEDGGRPRSWQYQVREFGKADDTAGTTIATYRAAVNPRCAFHAEIEEVDDREIVEIRFTRSSTIRDIWHMLNGVFGKEGIYQIDLRWSAVYYMVYPEGATRDENRVPPVNVISVDDRDDEELDTYNISRLPPDHIYMVTECSGLDPVKRIVRIRVG